MSADLLTRWRALAGDDADALGRTLIAAYAEPHRRYHSQGHLTWLLDESERRTEMILDGALVGFAIWFHDAIYDPQRSDNEDRSADWAEAALAARGDFATRVGSLVRMTKRHADGDAGPDEALFLDMDMAVLGAPPAGYRAYAAGVRAEYAFVSEQMYAVGRATFLESILAGSRVYRTDFYELTLGDVARDNMRWEAAELRQGRMVVA